MGELTEPGDVALIEANFVIHREFANFGDDCLFSSPSVVAPIMNCEIKA